MTDLSLLRSRIETRGLPARKPIAVDYEEAERQFAEYDADPAYKEWHREDLIRQLATAAMQKREHMARQAFVPTYRGNSPCPGCGKSHWWVGRTMAECGFCSTAIPLGRAA